MDAARPVTSPVKSPTLLLAITFPPVCASYAMTLYIVKPRPKSPKSVTASHVIVTLPTPPVALTFVGANANRFVAISTLVVGEEVVDAVAVTLTYTVESEVRF